MKKQCPICQHTVEEDTIRICQEAQDWIIDAIRHQHPDWVKSDGTCSKCLDYYRRLGEKPQRP